MCLHPGDLIAAKTSHNRGAYGLHSNWTGRTDWRWMALISDDACRADVVPWEGATERSRRSPRPLVTENRPKSVFVARRRWFYVVVKDEEDEANNAIASTTAWLLRLQTAKHDRSVTTRLFIHCIIHCIREKTSPTLSTVTLRKIDRFE